MHCLLTSALEWTDFRRPLLIWDHSEGDWGLVETGSYRRCCSIQFTGVGFRNARAGDFSQRLL
ncbi:hypothetical protein DPMN_123369 [Dreissena polymorpha]|uniref:Uncharacterized protein n=1 Tax=Dreissena polymorpha TaxID=45954 RepID=A0A9D4GQR3_DREPO|nr:hypothetical protein DPMN_123369 [Dreissena polymorpha]